MSKVANNIEDLEGEVWKPVVGYEGYYEVSNLGRVRSVDRTIKTISRSGNNFYKQYKGSMRKPHLNRDGYLYVSLCIGDRGKTFKIHRLVADAFHLKSSDKCFVDHIDGNKTNNRADNLRWCTFKENIQFAWDAGIYNNVGESHGMASLKESDVIEIKNRIKSGESCKKISKDFNVKHWTIHDIKQGRTWSHVKI